MSTFKSLIGRFSKSVILNGRSGSSSRIYVTAAPRPLQESKKEKEIKMEKDLKTIEAMEKVKDTAEYVKEAAAKTTDSVTSMANSITDAISDTTKHVAGKATDRIIEETTSYIKEKAKD